MHDVALVGVREPERDLPDERHAARDRQHAAGHRLGEAPALGEVHHHVQQSLGRLADVDGADDAGVLEAADDVGLAQEALAARRIERELAERHLHGEALRHAVVARAVHAAQPALAEQRLDHVAPGERRADQRITLLG